MKILKFGIVMLLSVTLWGCGKGNPAAPVTVDPVTQKAHPDPTWLATAHKKTKPAAVPGCAECHGGDFKGGIVKVSCVRCHPNGPGVLPHDIGTGYELPANHGGPAKSSLALCAGCHGGAANEPFNKITNSVMPTGCASASPCHFQNTNLAHPYGWLPGRGSSTSHATASDLVTSCKICHGALLDGVGAVSGAPSCSTFTTKLLNGVTVQCHSNGSHLAKLPAQQDCKSCHVYSAGTTGRHSFHLPPNVQGLTCSDCHGTPVGPGQATHANGSVTLTTMISTFKEAATPTYSSGTCANISCHGLNTPPTWVAASAPAAAIAGFVADCTNCHAVVNNASGTQGLSYINVYNGDPNTVDWYDIGPSLNQHQFHINDFPGAVCTDCHSLGKLATQHFTGISGGSRQLTPGFAVKATGGADTQVADYSYDGTPTIPAGNPIPRGQCITSSGPKTCHAGETNRFWFYR